jgi:hypothetical protein
MSRTDKEDKKKINGYHTLYVPINKKFWEEQVKVTL